MGIELIGIAQALKEPLEVDEPLIQMMARVQRGDTKYCVLQISKRKWRYQDAQSHDGLRRVDIFQVDGAAIVGPDVALEAIEDQRERVAIAHERATQMKGQGTFPDTGRTSDGTTS